MNKIKEKQLNEVLYGLDYIGNKIKNDDGKLELGVNNCKLLLDYITNLQEENKRLKEYQESYRKELDFWRIQFSNKEDRIDKAIEYIERLEVNSIGTPYSYTERGKDLLNILRGEDNE